MKSHFDEMREAAPWPPFFDLAAAASLGALTGLIFRVGPVSAPCLGAALAGAFEGVWLGDRQLSQGSARDVARQSPLHLRMPVLAAIEGLAGAFAWVEPSLLGLLGIHAPFGVRVAVVGGLCAVAANAAAPRIFVSPQVDKDHPDRGGSATSGPS